MADAGVRLSHAVTSLSVILCLLLHHACAMSPVLYTQGHDPCFPADTDDAVVCYPTRCFHLFNVTTSSGLSPTPKSGYPQNYTAFRCQTELYEEYPGYSARLCKKAMCYCNSGYNRYNRPGCSPAKLADCWNQTCVA